MTDFEGDIMSIVRVCRNVIYRETHPPKHLRTGKKPGNTGAVAGMKNVMNNRPRAVAIPRARN